MKVYLAGPMRGKLNDNREAFAEARERWRKAGHTVFCPHAITDSFGQCDVNLRQCIQIDFVCIEHAEAIVLLQGWEGSVGATVELAYAHFLGLLVYNAETMKELNPVRCPWYEVLGSRNWPVEKN